MKRVFYAFALLMAVTLTACAQGKTKKQQAMKQTEKALVVFFSRTGENYAVGNIKMGNTHIVADMIVSARKADAFQIEPVTAYPTTYDACVDLAKKEQVASARPAVKGDVKVENYDVIFIGYPNWWGDLPMPVYTFIEKHNWSGKKVIPFCTHEGSGLGTTPRNIEKACKGATVLKGFAIRGATAQNQQAETKKAVEKWLSGLNL